jgi:hypothetical protein
LIEAARITKGINRQHDWKNNHERDELQAGSLAMNMIVARGGLLLEFSGRIELVLSAFLVTGDMVTNMNGPALNAPTAR